MMPHTAGCHARSSRSRWWRSRFSCRMALLLTVLFAPSATAHAQPLFRTDSVLTVTITTNLRELIRERDSTELQWFGAEFAYVDGDSTVTLPVELRARGHFRRQRSNCEFPPLFVRVKDQDARGTQLQGNPRVKLVTPCRPGNDEYQQYILLEYGVYRTYAALNPIHPRTRLAQITYRDSSDRTKLITVQAFFSETEEEVAKEFDMSLRDNLTGARFRDLDAPTLQSVALFALMVGSADWSIGGLHNVYLLQDSLGTFRPVAYDWDWVGLVSARYARPDYRLPIKSVAERYYMGPCYTAEEWSSGVARYLASRSAVDAVWSAIPNLTDNRRQQAARYLGDFWKILENPRELTRLTKSCRLEGN